MDSTTKAYNWYQVIFFKLIFKFLVHRFCWKYISFLLTKYIQGICYSCRFRNCLGFHLYYISDIGLKIVNLWSFLFKEIHIQTNFQKNYDFYQNLSPSKDFKLFVEPDYFKVAF